MHDDPDPLLGWSPFRTVAFLGRGGMGEILEAEHVALKTRVVVKLLHLHFAEHPGLADRMRLEAQTLARLAPHPNLVMVQDFGTTPSGRTYLVMERLYGRTLGAELEARGSIPISDAIEMVRQVLCGLSAAHRAGIVHRDIKLENLFLCDATGEIPRTVKVLDFGIAKVLSGARRAPAPVVVPTEEGVVVGTPRFLSPEQALNHPVDQRADLYAVGAVLYTLLSGRGPFDDARRVADLLKAHVMREPTTPSRIATQRIPPELDAAVLTALAKRPEDRFPTAAAFSAALARIATALGPIHGDTQPPPRARPDVTARGTIRMLPAPSWASHPNPPRDAEPPGEPPDTSAPDLTAILSDTPPGAPAPPRSRIRPTFVLVTVLSSVGFSAAITLLLELFR